MKEPQSLPTRLDKQMQLPEKFRAACKLCLELQGCNFCATAHAGVSFSAMPHTYMSHVCSCNALHSTHWLARLDFSGIFGWFVLFLVWVSRCLLLSSMLRIPWDAQCLQSTNGQKSRDKSGLCLKTAGC